MTARVIEIVDVTTAKRIVLGRAVGRSAAIVCITLAHGERLNAMLRGRVTFYLDNGERIKPEIVEQLEGN